MTCDQVEQLLVDELLGDGDARDRRDLFRHLEGCDRCRAAAVEIRDTLGHLGPRAAFAGPPATLRSRVLARVHAEAVAAQASRRPPRISLGHRPWTRVPAASAVVAGLVAAAAVAVIVVAVHRSPSPPRPPTVVTSCAVVGEPRICGQLKYESAAKLGVITVAGLDPIPMIDGAPVASYEIWLVRPDHTAVAAGFLMEAVTANLFTAAVDADLTKFVSVDATRESAIGSRYPTGPDVLHLDLASSSS